MMNKENIYYYILYSLIGGTILPLQYYLSLQNNSKICAFLPTIPILGLSGLFFIIFNNGFSQGNKYITNHLKFLSVTISMYIIILIINYITENLLLAVSIGIIMWVITNYLII